MNLHPSDPPVAPRRRWLRWLIVAFLVYTLVGFFILPPIIRSVARKQIAKELGREVSIKKVKLNPYVLSATIRGLLIKDKDGEPFVSWDEVYVNFQLSSFFRKPWVFKEIRTTKPFIRLQLNKDYTLNCSDIIAKAAADTNAPAKPSKPTVLRVDKLQIQGATASLTDLTPRRPFHRELGPLNLTLTGFQTSPDNRNPYSFEGTSDAGEQFSWSGFFYLDPIRSEGKVSVKNFTLNRYAPLYEDFVSFVIKDGAFDTGATYRFELSPTNLVAAITNAYFSLHSLKVAEPNSDENIAEVGELTVSGMSADAVARHAEIVNVSGTGHTLRLRRNAEAALNVVEMSKPKADATNAPGGILLLLQSVTNVAAMFVNSTNQWTGIVREVDFRNGAISLEDLANSRPARLELDEISISARNISNLPGSNLTSSVSLRWNTNGTIKVDTEGAFQPLTANVQLALDNLDLHPLDPYLESVVDVFILKSKLGMSGKIHVSEGKEKLPDVKFAGDVWLNDFSTVDTALGEDLLKWESVRVSSIDANLNPPEANIKEIAINGLTAKVAIETNKTINVLAALHMADTNVAAGSKPEKAKPAKKTPAVAKENAPSATNTSALAGMPKVTIAAVVISNAQLQLADRSVAPAVNMGVEEIGGTISGLSFDGQNPATLDLHAKVENTGPVEITGTVNPLPDKLAADVKLAVKNVDLTPTSPYSGKFAGYEIAKGKLGVDLAYKISDRKLAAQNVIVLDQFTFGRKVESPDAIKLPVKLGVAVLKDRNGRIQLDVPVEGSLDDPEFHFGKMIPRAIWNVITKVLTSPFSVLGSMFGGKGEELSYQEFVPGRAALQQVHQEKLDSMIKALYERPALQVEIEGSVDENADREGLRRVKLVKQLRTRKWMSLSKSERAATTPEQLTFTADDSATWLRTLYQTALDKGEVSLTIPAASTNAVYETTAPVAAEPPKGAGALLAQKQTSVEERSTVAGGVRPRRAETPEEMALALMAVIPIADTDFQDLATARAKAVQDYILQSGRVEAERVFLSKHEPTNIKRQGARAYLQLQ